MPRILNLLLIRDSIVASIPACQSPLRKGRRVAGDPGSIPGRGDSQSISRQRGRSIGRAPQHRWFSGKITGCQSEERGPRAARSLCEASSVSPGFDSRTMHAYSSYRWNAAWLAQSVERTTLIDYYSLGVMNLMISCGRGFETHIGC